MEVTFLILCLNILVFSNSENPVTGRGYNILFGNPDGVNPISGGKDPGILQRQILNSNIYTTDSHFNIANSNDSNNLGNTSDTCEKIDTVEWFYGEKSYQDKLLKSFQISGDGNFKIQRLAFTSSPQFVHHKYYTFPSHQVVQEFHETCLHEGTKSLYGENTWQNRNPSVTDEFAAAVCGLSSVYDAQEYRKFLETWGTHVIFAAEAGKKKIKRYKKIDVEYFDYVENKVPEAILPYLNKDARTIDFRVFASSPYFQTRYGDYMKTLHVGNDEELEPVFLKLISIDMMFQKQFWNLLNRFIAQSTCNDNTSVQTIADKKNLVIQALNEYNNNASIPQDKNIVVPTIWPKGTYALVKVQPETYGSTVCPSGVRWDSGTVNWCTEDQKNDWSQSQHFAGSMSTGYIQLSFCVKREEAPNREVKDWPKGDYCIPQYSACPKGFSSGYIRWDTKDNRYSRRNHASGHYPSGSYTTDITMNFCCRNDSDPSRPITLPRDKPFYLVRNNGSKQCQQVNGMTSKEEYITWDNENNSQLYKNNKITSDIHPLMNVTRDFDITMYFCYYHK
ncbi:uncharacterized protein LOC127725515 isoform X2 [Mytilus californianus]|uniref:uncharacterized protein LOC127725515 isoform X2 n=1 Tax=Mytilus californianus TaxID=6549 RepID=UPI002247BB50|nr:uncharacterized protein LOC127725515 isoform X2 [Mytilus californianus]